MKHTYLTMKYLVVLFLLIIGTQNAVAQSSVTITPSKDNTLIQDANGAKSNAKFREMYSGRVSSSKYPNGYKRRAIMEFDVSSAVPPGSTIDSVVLTLRCTKAHYSTSRTHTLHKVTSEWGEGTSNYSGGKGANSTSNDATWKHTFYSGSNWTNLGGDYVSTASATTNIAGTGSYIFTSTAMKNDVQSWVNNSSNNHGWILIGDETVNQSVKHIGSRENASASNRPQLTIYYSCAKANFTSSFGCQDAPIQFTSTSTNAASYLWDFDNDGVTDDTAANPTYTFTTPGSKPVRLIALNSGGCRDTIKKNALVFSKPNVTFTHDTGCVDGALKFTASLNGSKYEWDWDNDGVYDNTVSTISTTHTFSTVGSRSVKLRMTDFGGCVGDITQQVVVFSKPTVGFSADTVCGKSVTTFMNNSTAATNTNTYYWDWDNDGIADDSTFNTNNTTHIYPSGGIKPTELLIVTEHNCRDSVTVNVNVYSVPLISLQIDTVCLSVVTDITDNSTVPVGSSYKWDFDDDGVYDDFTGGNKQQFYSTVGKNPIKLVIEAPNGCKDSLMDSAIIEPGITASVMPDTACDGAATIFTDNSTTTSSAAYSWDFDNDGTVDNTTKGNVTNTYTVGTHTAKLYIEDADGCKDSTVFTVDVKPLPIVSFTADSVCFGSATSFTDNSTTTTTAQYNWDFNNDGTSDDNTQGNTSATLGMGGNLMSKLTITDDYGCIDSLTIDILVKQKAFPSFSINQNDPNVSLTNNSTGTITSFEWDFGDDSTNNTDTDPTHTYVNTNTYNICLKLTNECGDSTLCQSISIIGSSVSNIALINAFSIAPNPFAHIINISSLKGYSYNLKVTDIQGRVIYTKRNNAGDTPIDLSKFSKGVYFINIETQLGTINYKVIKSE